MVARRVAGVVAGLMLMTAVAHAGVEDGLKKGSPELKSAGPMTFGPSGVLFISDPQAATIYAVATDDATGDAGKVSVNVKGLKDKVAGLLGTMGSQVQINDLAVNPKSGTVYLSVTRGQGSDSQPVVLRVDGSGKLSEFALKNVRFAKAELPNAPEDKVVGQGRRKRNNRTFSITDLAFVDGRLIVAGLTNEEFASNLRAIPYPFQAADRGSAVEIYHGNHGGLETRSPVRTFVPITIGGEPQIIAAYTCTPLVRFPLSDLKAGKKVVGTTIAELGNRNRPLDIIAYEKGGKSFLLMANNPRGVMKITTDEITTRKGITERVGGIAGQPYTTVEELKNVTQLDRLNKTSAVVLIEDGAQAELKTIPLP